MLIYKMKINSRMKVMHQLSRDFGLKDEEARGDQ